MALTDKLTAIADAIRDKTGEIDKMTLDDMPDLIDTIQGKYDVNFIDYDGTIVKGYSAQAFAKVTELPANPEHEGLISKGWNYTLETAQKYVAEYGYLTIGQQYATVDDTYAYVYELPADGMKVSIELQRSEE